MDVGLCLKEMSVYDFKHVLIFTAHSLLLFLLISLNCIKLRDRTCIETNYRFTSQSKRPTNQEALSACYNHLILSFFFIYMYTFVWKISIVAKNTINYASNFVLF